MPNIQLQECEMCGEQQTYLIGANFTSDNSDEQGKVLKKVCIKCYRKAESEALERERELEEVRKRLKSEGKL